MKTTLNMALVGAVTLFFVLEGCKPFEEEGIELPGAPSASISWEFIDAIDSTGQVVGVDSNRVFVSADPVDGAFLQLWDFGNGQTSDRSSDTTYYPVEGEYALSYSVHTAGGMGTATATIVIDQTLELPCEGTKALLTGCDNQRTWKLSNEAGAISVGPAPYSTEWYTSPADGHTE